MIPKLKDTQQLYMCSCPQNCGLARMALSHMAHFEIPTREAVTM